MIRLREASLSDEEKSKIRNWVRRWKTKMKNEKTYGDRDGSDVLKVLQDANAELTKAYASNPAACAYGTGALDSAYDNVMWSM